MHTITLKKTLLVAVLALMSVALFGCQAKKEAVVTEPVAEEEKTIQVITTLFPEYDIVKALAGDNVNVRMLMPPGSESHSYEPTPKDIVDIQNADVFIYTSEAMEPWVEKLLDQAGPKTIIVEAAKDVHHFTEEEMGLGELAHEHEEEHSEEANATGEANTAGEAEDHDHEVVDPHVWMDPANMVIMSKTINEALKKASPDLASDLDSKLATYTEALNKVDKDYTEVLKSVEHREIVFAGHFALGYLAKKYDIHVHSPYEGFSPDTEPAPQKIAEMVDFMKAENQKVVYYEELIDPKIARIISSETGAEMVMLHAAHNLSKEELDSGLTYVKIMEQNLEKLKKGFGM